jgi:hypothetical protein
MGRQQQLTEVGIEDTDITNTVNILDKMIRVFSYH